MKTNEDYSNLTKYFMDNKVILTGFDSFSSAENYAKLNQGNLVEVAFLDANDNPILSNEGNLVKNKIVYYADAGPEYEFLYSDNPQFKTIATDLMLRQDLLMDKGPLNKFFGDSEASFKEDPVIILKNGNFDSVTSRETSKYGKGAKVYEIGVMREVF